MRQNITVCALLMAAMILLPLAAMQSDVNAENVNSVPDSEYDGYISVMKTENGKVEDLDTTEYLVGVLAAEVDMKYHEEALRAQAVAAYTYALYIKKSDLSESLNGADISDDPQMHQGYLTVEERKEKWGNNFDEYEKRTKSIVESVKGKMIVYNNEPIMAVYHDLNNGRTQSAQTVWKKDVPYLVQTESPGDRLSNTYSKEEKFTYQQFKELIEKIDGVQLDGESKEWIGKTVKNDDGYVTSVEVCSDSVSSADFRVALGLRSCCFEIDSSDDGITVRTFGNGHMVGMSQYGADYMARQGSDYEEILAHYYKNIEIQ